MANVGTVLHRISRTLCSPRLQRAVLEPAIADLQHDYAGARGTALRARALVSGYAAFWQALASCIVRDASTVDARGYFGRAAVAFGLTVAAVATAEALLMQPWALRGDILRLLLTHGTLLRYVGWRAHLDSLTLTYGVPLAMFPAMFAAAHPRRAAPATVVVTLIAGVSLTIVASGWIAPALVRWEGARERAAFIAATGGRLYLAPDGGDLCPDCEAWPALIRGAWAPPYHRYPGYPNYVAPEDRGAAESHRGVIRERLLLIAFAWVVGLAGWWLGASRARCGTA